MSKNIDESNKLPDDSDNTDYESADSLELENQTETTGSMGDNLTKTIDGEKDYLAKTVDSQGENLSETISAQGDNLTKTIDGQGDNLTEEVDAPFLNSNTDTDLENLEKSNEVDKAVGECLKEMESMLVPQGDGESVSRGLDGEVIEPSNCNIGSEDPICKLSNAAHVCSDEASQEGEREDISNANLSDAKETVRHLCDTCSSENLEMKAVSFCISCIEYMCENCNRFHSKCKATKDHKVTENLPEDTSVYKSMVKLLSCPQHLEFNITHYCQDHKVNVCLQCRVGTHRNCGHLQKLENTLSSERAAMAEDVLVELENQIQLVDTYIEQRRRNMEEMITEKNSILHNISEQAENLITAIVSLKMKAKQEVRQVVEAEINSLQKDIDLCTSFEGEEETDRRVLDFFAADDKSFDTKLLRHIILGKVQKRKETLSRLMSKSKHVFFSKNEKVVLTESFGEIRVFNVDDVDFKDRLERSLPTQTEVSKPQSLGLNILAASTNDVNTTLTSLAPSSAASNKSQSSSESSLSPTSDDSSKAVSKTTPYIWSSKPKMSAAPSLPQLDKIPQSSHLQYSIRLVDDPAKKCNISKCVLLKSGAIALVDSTNKKLKKFTADFRRCSYMKLEADVTDICNPDGEEVAILYKDKHVIVVNVLGGPTAVEVRRTELPKSQNFKCIAADRVNRRFALLYDTQFGAHPKVYNRIRIQKYEGQVLCDFDLESLIGKDVKVSLTVANCGLCYTAKGLILVGVGLGVRRIPAENKGDEVVLKKSIILYDCKEKDISGMTNLASDTQGNIYICSNNNGGSVIQFFRSLSYRPTVLLKGLSKPTCLDVFDDGRLLVGCWYDNIIHVHNYKKG